MVTPARTTELQMSLEEAIRHHVAESPLNRLKDIDGSPIFEAPLVGFADGDDPLFTLYKSVIGEFHLTPREALAGPDGDPAAFEHVGVVSWVLPVNRETVRSNAERSDGPSLRWNNTRFQGEDYNDALRAHVVALLRERGRRAVAPMNAPYFKTLQLANGRASNWSERHVAYAAGLGTFSLTDALITERGIAHRVGSVVTDELFVPSERPYTRPYEYCPGVEGGACQACIDRCPGGALSEKGHDKLRCRDFMMVEQADWLKKPGYIGTYPGCGLCLTGVPCEGGIPPRKG